MRIKIDTVVINNNRQSDLQTTRSFLRRQNDMIEMTGTCFANWIDIARGLYIRVSLRSRCVVAGDRGFDGPEKRRDASCTPQCEGAVRQECAARFHVPRAVSRSCLLFLSFSLSLSL